MEKETVTKTMQCVDDQGTVRDVEITVRKDAGTRFEIGVTMYYDEQGVAHDIVGMLVEKYPRLRHIDLKKCNFIDGGSANIKGQERA